MRSVVVAVAAKSVAVFVFQFFPVMSSICTIRLLTPSGTTIFVLFRLSGS